MLLRYYVCYHGPVLRYVCQKLQLQLRSATIDSVSQITFNFFGLYKISVWPQACKQSVFQRNHSEKKQLLEFYPQNGGESLLASNHVTVTLCIR